MVEHSKADRDNAILLFYWIMLLKEVGTNYKEELRTLMRGTSKNIAKILILRNKACSCTVDWERILECAIFQGVNVCKNVT